MKRFEKENQKVNTLKYYYDDSKTGLSPKTSHPNFVKVATDAFFYSEGDDFSPFGNDDGSDGLRMLEDWFKSGGGAYGVIHFLRDTIASWDLGVPQNLDHKTAKSMTTWLNKDQMHDRYLASDCRLRIAVALGQLKICGIIDAPVLHEAKIGIKWMEFLNVRASKEFPDWEYADLEASRITLIKKALNSYKNKENKSVPSKKERKLLVQKSMEEREKAKKEKDEEFQYFHIFSDSEFSLSKWMKLFIKELKSFNVNLNLSIIDSNIIKIEAPNIDVESSCYLRIGDHSKITVQILKGYEDKYNKGISVNIITKCFITLYGKRNKNDVINLVFNTSTRILGRLSKGILVDVEQEYIGDDWIVWSCDYFDDDLFKAFNYENLSEKYPNLVAKKRWKIFNRNS